MDGQQYIADATREFKRLRKLVEDAIAQVPESAMLTRLDANTNSIAIVMKHLAGNMQSRWQDFLTTDGEKPTRNRDAEFVIGKGDSLPAIATAWERGWQLAIDTMTSLEPRDLKRKVVIRGEQHLVSQAIERQLLHLSYHVGQIVLLARHFAGDRWVSLSIPRDRSDEYAKKGSPYLNR